MLTMFDTYVRTEIAAQRREALVTSAPAGRLSRAFRRNSTATPGTSTAAGAVVIPFTSVDTVRLSEPEHASARVA